jgi:hypothetical protein
MSETAEKQSTTTVVTGENLLEFQLSRMKPIAAEEPVEPPKADADLKVDEPPKPKNKIEQRFSEITAQKRAAEERAQALEDEIKALKAAKTAELPKPIADPTAKPLPSQFTDAFEYAGALADWSANNALRERDRADAERAEKQRVAQMQAEWKKREAQAHEEFPDYDEIVGSSNVTVSDQVKAAIEDSDAGPKLVYYLASNPEFVDKLNTMTALGAVRAIGKLEAALEKPKAAEKTAEVVKTVVRPPAPIAPIRAATIPDDPIASDGEFHGSFAQFKALRKAKRVN